MSFLWCVRRLAWLALAAGLCQCSTEDSCLNPQTEPPGGCSEAEPSPAAGRGGGHTTSSPGGQGGAMAPNGGSGGTKNFGGSASSGAGGGAKTASDAGITGDARVGVGDAHIDGPDGGADAHTEGSTLDAPADHANESGRDAPDVLHDAHPHVDASDARRD